jgi:hypothetical protein
MRRLYFLVPDVQTARKIVDELLLARIEERHMHLVAKEGTPMEDLPEATFLQKTDFVPALEKGLALGGATGAIAGLVAMFFPPAGLIFGGGAVLATALAGAGVGAWVSSMVGAAIPNSRVKEFEQAIEQGQVLMMVDVRKDRVEEVEEMIKQHHPEAEVEGTEPTIPPFP